MEYVFAIFGLGFIVTLVVAKGILQETESPTLTELPPLEYHQTKRADHRLLLRRH